MSVIITVIVALVPVFAIVLLTLGIRGRAVPCAPACAACRHAIGTLEVAETSRCAECGGSLNARDGLRHFERRLQSKLVILSVAIFVLGVAGLLGAAFIFARIRTVTSGVTTPAALSDAVAERGSDAWSEINALARLSSSYSDTDLDLVVAGLMRAARAGRFSAWLPPDAADIARVARSRGRLTDDEYADLVDASMRPLDIEIADDVRVGSTFHVSGGATQVATGATRTPRVESVRLGGRTLALERFSEDSGHALVRFDDMEPGIYELETTFDVQRALVGTMGPLPALNRKETVKRQVRIHATDAPSWIGLSTDPAHADSVRDAVRATAVSIDSDGRGRSVLRTDVVVLPIDAIPLAYRCEIEIGGRRYPVGDRWSYRYGSSATHASGVISATIDSPPTDINEATIILSPTPTPVEPVRGIRSISGLEIRLKLPIARDREPSRPALGKGGGT